MPWVSFVMLQWEWKDEYQTWLYLRGGCGAELIIPLCQNPPNQWGKEYYEIHLCVCKQLHLIWHSSHFGHAVPYWDKNKNQNNKTNQNRNQIFLFRYTGENHPYRKSSNYSIIRFFDRNCLLNEASVIFTKIYGQFEGEFNWTSHTIGKKLITKMNWTVRIYPYKW